MKKFMTIMSVIALTLLTACSNNDDGNQMSSENGIMGLTPVELLTGTWMNNLNSFIMGDSAITYCSFSENGKGWYMTFDQEDGMEQYEQMNYTYNNETGEGSIQVMYNQKNVFAAADGCIAMLDENDSLGLFTKISDQAITASDIIFGYDVRNNAKSDIASWAGPESYNPDILVDMSDIDDNSSSAKTGKVVSRADADEALMPAWVTSILGTVCSSVFDYCKNEVVGFYVDQGDEDMFGWFTDSKKLNRIYDKIRTIQLDEKAFANAQIKFNDDKAYTQMDDQYRMWHNRIQSAMGQLEELPEKTDTTKLLNVAKEWADMSGNNIPDFLTYIQTLTGNNFQYIINANNVVSKNVDVLDFIAQWGFYNYAWKSDMYAFYRAYTGCLAKTIRDGFMLSCLYYQYVKPNKQMLKDFGVAENDFEHKLSASIKKLKPNPDEVECLVPNCHICMKREIPLHNYNNILPKGSVTVKDLYSYEYSCGGTQFKENNIAWTLALDPKQSTTLMDDTLYNFRDARLTQSNVNAILKAFENNEEYKDNLIKILLNSAKMTFKSDAAVDTTKLCLYTHTTHGYASGVGIGATHENIPLILPNESTVKTDMTSGSKKIYNELGGYEQNVFALTGYKYGSPEAKAYKVGKLNVTEKKVRHWYTLWIPVTEARIINGISNVENPYWLIPYVTKRYNKSAGEDY